MVDASATLSSGAATVNANATLTAPQPKPYPQPPTGLTLDPDDPDVLTIYERFRGYLQDREPLTGMAYFCLSMLEKHLSDSRNAAARNMQSMKTFSAGLETSLQTGAAEQPLGKRVVSAMR